MVTAIREKLWNATPTSGEFLTEKEFYLAASQGLIINLGPADGLGPYDYYQLLYYDGDERTGIIDHKITEEEPERSKEADSIGLATIIAPENVKVKHLREEQHEYFEEQRPKLYSRFDNS